MMTFKIEVSTEEGNVIVDVLAESIYHAIELLMFKHGMFRVQSNREKYKQVKSK